MSQATAPRLEKGPLAAEELQQDERLLACG
jgi:hypothetical protein